MKQNVIDNQFAIECRYDGKLEIIGKFQGYVVFRLSGRIVDDLRRELPSFCKNAIFTQDVVSMEDFILFEKSLGGELRNPRKLLKSVRNKLVRTSYRNSVVEEMEYNAMYEMTDRQFHEMAQSFPAK